MAKYEYKTVMIDTIKGIIEAEKLQESDWEFKIIGIDKIQGCRVLKSIKRD